MQLGNKRLGGRFHGNIYAGRLTFNDGSRSQVAVKVFRAPRSFSEIRKYEAAIRRLANAGVRIPKTGFVKHEGKWVQVMERFPENRLVERGFEGARDLIGRHLSGVSAQERLAFLKDFGFQFANIVKAGFCPMEDTVQYHSPANGVLRPVVVDLDFFPKPDFFPSPALRREGFKPYTTAERIQEAVELLLLTLPDEHHGHAVRAFFGELPYKRSKAKVLSGLLKKKISTQAKLAIEGLGYH